MRIRDITNLLGFGGDGSIHTTDCWFCRSPRRRRWSGTVPDVLKDRSCMIGRLNCEFGNPDYRRGEGNCRESSSPIPPLHPYIYGRPYIKDAASILDAFWMTHLHYCQRTTAGENWFLRPAGYDLETHQKRDKRLNGKALNRTAREADQIH